MAIRGAVALVVLAAVSAASARSGVAKPVRQILVLDAVTLQAAESGPQGLRPGHVDSTTGILRDSSGRTVGRFTSTCVVLKTLPGKNALLRCGGSGVTPDGRLAFTGRVRASARTPTAPLGGGTGAYRGARGTITEYPITPKETLVSVAVAPRAGSRLRVGVVARPGPNAEFRVRADGVCATAGRRLGKVRLFPFALFVSRRPSPQRLAKLGRFLTAADARPALRALDAQLGALGRPPADGSVWLGFLADRRSVLAALDAVDHAALAANVDAFARAVRRGAAAERGSAITALVFGAPACML